jgi:hypothetical protein
MRGAIASVTVGKFCEKASPVKTTASAMSGAPAMVAIEILEPYEWPTKMIFLGIPIVPVYFPARICLAIWSRISTCIEPWFTNPDNLPITIRPISESSDGQLTSKTFLSRGDHKRKSNILERWRTGRSCIFRAGRGSSNTCRDQLDSQCHQCQFPFTVYRNLTRE